MLEVLTPDGSIIGEGTFGRGDHGQTDPTISRTQFALSKVQKNLYLKNTAANPIQIATDLDGSETVVDFLLKDETAKLEEGTYFYIPTRKATTTYHVRRATSSLATPSLGSMLHSSPPASLGGMSSALTAGTPVISLSSSSEDDEPGPHRKRPRIQPSSAPGPSGGPARDAQEGGAGPSADLPFQPRSGSSGASPGVWAPPFSLMKVDGIPDAGNMPPGNIRLGDLVKGSMKFVLVSNYMIDFRWLLSFCPDMKRAGHVQVVVHGGKVEAERKLSIMALKDTANVAGLIGEERFSAHCPPLPIPFGTHHSKFFLIEYETGLRVVIHTANLIFCDCHNKSQGIWVQDFPRKDARSPRSSDFEVDMVDYLKALQIPKDPKVQSAISRCALHDFSSARARLIASTPGRHPSSKAVGHLALRQALRKETFDPIFRNAPVFAQFSSLGSLDANWVHNEFQRDTLSAGKYLDVEGQRKTLGAGPADATGFHLIWPTVSEVQNCVEGWFGGNSIPGMPKTVQQACLQPLWHRFGGQPMMRQRASPHIKSFGRYVSVAGKGARLAWLLLTSHNLSKAAWGGLQTNNSILFVRSYELGALLLPSLESLYRQHRHCGFSCTPTPPVVLPEAKPDGEEVEFWARGVAGGSKLGAQDGGCHLPLPYKLPPDRYSGDDKPWMVGAKWPGLDSHGRTIDAPPPSHYGHLET